MAIAYDNSIDVAIGSGTSQTLAYTCSGTDRVLLVGILKQGASNTTTGVTYGGVSMTNVGGGPIFGDGSGENIYLYMLVNPASGSNNIVASFNGSGTSGICAASYTGCKQTGQPDASTNNRSASTTSLTTSLTTIADNCWLAGYFRSGGTLTAGANTTLRGTASNIMMGDTNSAQTPAGSKSVNSTQLSASNMAHIIVSLSPVAASGPANLKSYNTNVAANIKSINTNPIANVKSLNTNV